MLQCLEYTTQFADGIPVLCINYYPLSFNAERSCLGKNNSGRRFVSYIYIEAHDGDGNSRLPTLSLQDLRIQTIHATKLLNLPAALLFLNTLLGIPRNHTEQALKTGRDKRTELKN